MQRRRRRVDRRDRCKHGDDGERADTPTESTDDTARSTNPASTTDDPTTAPTPGASTTTEPTTTSATTTTTTTTTAPAPPPTAPPGREGFDPPPEELLPLTIVVPSGAFRQAPGDLVVLRTNGDLEYLPNGLAPSPGNRADPILIADRPDPRPAAAEGPGPNVIDDLAGIVDGSFVYGDCCEPVSGNLYAAAGPNAETGPIAVGFAPNLSPSGDLLATANGMQLSVASPATGAGRTLLLEQKPGELRRQILDIEWLDDDTFATVALVENDHIVEVYDASTLSRWRGSLNLDPVVDIDEPVRFAGVTPDGLLAIAVPEPGRIGVLYYDVLGQGEASDRQQNFPTSVRRIEIDDDGLGQIWVDGTTLYHLPPGAFIADPVAQNVLAGWFIDP